MNGYEGENNQVSARALDMMMQVTVSAPLESPSLVETVVRRFTAAMSIGILSVGERLPPESVLAEHLGISPLTLRHGLFVLRNQGLVGTRRGRGGGSFISGQVVIDDSDIDARLGELSTDQIRDLYDLAATVARGAARLGALRANTQEFRSLRARSANLIAESTPSGLRRAAGRFHIGLGVAAQSPQITSLLVRLQAELAPLSWHSQHLPHRIQSTHEEYVSIIDAMQTGDPGAAEALVSAHFATDQAQAIERHLTLLEESDSP